MNDGESSASSELGPLFDLRAEPGQMALQSTALGIAALAALILLCGLLRGRLARASAWLGLVVLPWSAFALAQFSLLEHARSTEFCASCHVMGPVVAAALAGPDSLAALHVQRGVVPRAQACYSCHRGYGISGGARAKFEGIEHVVRAAAQRVRYPLHVYQPYDVRACLACHASTQAFRAVPAHRDRALQDALLAGQLSCAGTCHPPAHPQAALQEVAAP